MFLHLINRYRSLGFLKVLDAHPKCTYFIVTQMFEYRVHVLPHRSSRRESALVTYKKAYNTTPKCISQPCVLLKFPACQASGDRNCSKPLSLIFDSLVLSLSNARVYEPLPPLGTPKTRKKFSEHSPMLFANALDKAKATAEAKKEKEGDALCVDDDGVPRG